ncbi:MAG: alpha-mannosidase, partial [Acidobacteriaceae bacterium]
MKPTRSSFSLCSLAFGIVLLAVLFQAHKLLAQAGQVTPYAFSPQAKQVIDRLGTFDSIPADAWQYHLGDIAHGERPDLDTTAWQTVHLPFTAPHGAVWLRRWVEVPKTLNGYDLAGSQIWFHMQVGANGPVPTILYYNGSRIALGDDLEKQLLFNEAKPGDKV